MKAMGLGCMSVVVAVGVNMASAQPVPATDPQVSHVVQDSLLALTAGSFDMASVAILDLELRIDPVQDSSLELEMEVVVHNNGCHPFRIPESLALPPGNIEVWWGDRDALTEKRRLRLGIGSRGASSWPQGFVFLPPRSSFVRKVFVRYDESNRFDPQSWPPGDYRFQIRMTLSKQYEAQAPDLDAWGVPRAVFQSETIEAKIE